MSHRIATSSATRAAALIRRRASPSSSVVIGERIAVTIGSISSPPSSSSPLSGCSSVGIGRAYTTNTIKSTQNLPPWSSRLLAMPGRSSRRANISSTSYLLADAEPQPAEEEEDPCPPWQNPLHHNNPDVAPGKIFAEDFEPGEEMPVIPLPPFEPDDGKVAAPPHVNELADEIVQLNMLEVAELVERMGDYYGFDDEAAFGDGGGEGGDGAAVEEVVEEAKTAFDLKLTGYDAKSKIKVIKEVRAVTSLGLKEAKELVEGAPTTVKKNIKQEEADELKTRLEAVGATVEIV